ncbi:unnamed protein product, partial [Phaeothamnion confervicola]
MVGNSRLHWAVLRDGNVVLQWDTSHLDAESGGRGVPPHILPNGAQQFSDDQYPASFSFQNTNALYVSRGPLRFTRFWAASVVPDEMEKWKRRCPDVRQLTSGDALAGIEHYPTLGSDRALAVRGGGERFGWPLLVVDCGSAPPLTAAD